MIAKTLQALRNEANNYISQARTQEAMDVVAEWAHENNQAQLKRNINLLKGQLSALNKQQIMGTVSFEEFMREQAKVNVRLLDLLSTLEEKISNDDVSSRPEPIKVSKLKILMLTANPTNLARLRLDSEHSNILQKLQGKQERFDFVIKKGVSKSEFQELTVQEKPDVLHFSGHGESAEYGVGGLILQDTDGREDILPPKGLNLLFRFFKSENVAIRVALLNACYSEEQAQAICAHVPYVIGTTLNIGDTAAIGFSTGFYYKLAENGTIEQAFNAGITRAGMDGADESYFALFKDGNKMSVGF